MQPTLWVTNWSSTRLQGPGPKFTIMARPRAWEHGEGVVRALVPDASDLRAIQAGTLNLDAYRAMGIAKLDRALEEGTLQPLVGLLATRTPTEASAAETFPVPDGATLCCACSKEKAANGHCHRTWVAVALARAGWRVILDGNLLAKKGAHVQLGLWGAP